MFITFEGLDFCGKTTQIKLLKTYLENQNKEVILVREPGGTPISEMIRAILLDKKNLEMSSKTELLLFEAARAQLTHQVILPAEIEHKFVLADRFYDSSTVYQGFGRGIPVEDINMLNMFATCHLTPDITFYFHLSLEELENRKKSRGTELDRMESININFYKRVMDGYEQLCKDPKRKIIKIDATKSIEEIHTEIINILKL